jgi:hypothetical protein
MTKDAGFLQKVLFPAKHRGTWSCLKASARIEIKGAFLGADHADLRADETAFHFRHNRNGGLTSTNSIDL